MRLPRFHLRTLMIAVAVAAVILALGLEARRLHRLSAEHTARAVALLLEERSYGASLARHVALLEVIADAYAVAATPGPAARSKALLVKANSLYWIEEGTLRRKLAHVAALRRKYEQAANRPWATVAPDPPEPR